MGGIMNKKGLLYKNGLKKETNIDCYIYVRIYKYIPDIIYIVHVYNTNILCIYTNTNILCSVNKYTMYIHMYLLYLTLSYNNGIHWPYIYIKVCFIEVSVFLSLSIQYLSHFWRSSESPSPPTVCKVETGWLFKETRCKPRTDFQSSFWTIRSVTSLVQKDPETGRTTPWIIRDPQVYVGPLLSWTRWWPSCDLWLILSSNSTWYTVTGTHQVLSFYNRQTIPSGNV